MAKAEVPQSDNPFQVPPSARRKLAATAGIEDSAHADQTSILTAKEHATGDVGGARYETGEMHQDRGKVVKIDRRRLSSRGKITADQGPNEVTETLERQSEGAVKDMNPDQRKIALEGLEAAKRILGHK